MKNPVPRLKMNSWDIKRLRESCFLDQDEFGALFGVSFAAVHQWETGRTSPPRRTMERLFALRRLNYSLIMNPAAAQLPYDITIRSIERQLPLTWGNKRSQK